MDYPNPGSQGTHGHRTSFSKMNPAPPTIKITVNGEDRMTSSMTVGALVAELKLEDVRVAVMLNEKIIRRDDRAHEPLLPGDIVEIISMVGGG